jgi:hypothetical protein
VKPDLLCEIHKNFLCDLASITERISPKLVLF